MTSASPAAPASAMDVQSAREAYMQGFSTVFEEELLAVYEAEGGSDEAIKQLRACVEVGVAVWGHPLIIGDPSSAFSNSD